MERISDLSKRLKEYRKMNDLSLLDISEKCGIPAQTINRYELGQRKPKIDTAVQIAESLNVNPLWLQGYNVPLKEESYNAEGQKKAAPKVGDGLTDTEQKLLAMFSCLSEDQQLLLLAQIETLLKYQK